jgi:hypothetical protein
MTSIGYHCGLLDRRNQQEGNIVEDWIAMHPIKS